MPWISRDRERQYDEQIQFLLDAVSDGAKGRTQLAKRLDEMDAKLSKLPAEVDVPFTAGSDLTRPITTVNSGDYFYITNTYGSKRVSTAEVLRLLVKQANLKYSAGVQGQLVVEAPAAPSAPATPTKKKSSKAKQKRSPK